MIAHYPNANVQYKRDTYRKEFFTVPADGVYGQIRFDWELEEYGNKPRPMPYTIPAVYQFAKAVYNFRDYDNVPLPREWQFALLGYFNWAADGLIPMAGLVKAYTRFIARHTAFTEAYPPEAGARDWVTMRNLDSKDYQYHVPGTTAGNMVKILTSGWTYYEVETMDVLKPPPEPKPWLLHWATQISPDGVVSRFPHLANAARDYGLSPIGTPTLFISRGGSVKIPKRHVRILKSGAAFQPYGRM